MLEPRQLGEKPGICPAIHQLRPRARSLASLCPLFEAGDAGGEARGRGRDSAAMCVLYPPPTEKSIPFRILYEKYCDCLTESNLIKVRGLLVEPAADSYLLAERDIYLENPEIKIRVRG